MAGQHQAQYEPLDAFCPLETWRLAQIVLTENGMFAETRKALVEQYGDDVLTPAFILQHGPDRVRRIISALNLGVERRVKEFNNRLHTLICTRFRWCERRDHPMVENAEIAAALVDIFGANGAAALTVFLLKRKFLDRLCGCRTPAGP
ncbi:hypothetical protein [Stenotrophomonas mori]|uniref:Uncharacterized protein n=1 Tax=Stenotrophomonas mori TaxID=2871096 RepID=A0ABT0SL20_9GAMM|nr:hypothetical protein [Stenotrophomonas mori]MCL7715798.1 hypothetical protein [Stenotrophomonas mori]